MDRRYVAAFYRQIPVDGDVPEWSVTVSASGLEDASWKAGGLAQKAGIPCGTYMIVRKEGAQ